MADPATVFLVVGLPAAGKTTRARELEASRPALRLTPDEWQITLFGDTNPARERDLVEGRLIEVGMRAAELGADVVLDFGLWTVDERSALRWIAAAVGARSEVVYLPVDVEEQRRRVAHRWATAPERTFPMSERDLVEWGARFEAPDEAELEGAVIPPVPLGCTTWSHWASRRWLSLPDRYAAPGVGIPVLPA